MKLRTPREVIDALGGVAVVSRLTGCSTNTIFAWRNRLNQIPPKTYVLLMKELERLGHRAPPEVWGMLERRRDDVR